MTKSTGRGNGSGGEGSAETKARLEALRNDVQENRDFNERWIALHLRDGHPAAAERRREIVAERDGWLLALNEVLGETE